jgi:ribosomal protein S18 acetylase RimI-like enzyme
MAEDNENKITYRRANMADLDTLVDLRIRFLNDFFKRSDGEDTAVLRGNLASYFSRAVKEETFIAWLAESGEEVVATSGMVIWWSPPKYGGSETGEKGYILNMYTVPEFRRKGIATRLLQELLKDAKERGLTYVHLHATMNGLQIYRKAGFSDPMFEELGMRLE